jgi:transcription antitermination factor NusG
MLFRNAASSSDALRWYALYTYPRHEKVVVDQLAAKQLDSFLPTLKSVREWVDRRVSIETPLFPTYVFARMCLKDRARALSIRSVIRILSFNGIPAPVDEAEMEAVRLCIDREARLTRHPFLAVGERVRVRRGLFQGLEGIVVRCSNSCKLVVTVGLIQQSVALDIDATLLDRIGTPAVLATDRPRLI